MAKTFDPTVQWSRPYPMRSQLAEAVRAFRQYGAQDAHLYHEFGTDNIVLKPDMKDVTGEIVETLQLEDKTNGEPEHIET